MKGDWKRPTGVEGKASMGPPQNAQCNPLQKKGIAFKGVRQLLEEAKTERMQKDCEKWKYSEEAFTGSAKKIVTVGLLNNDKTIEAIA